MRVERLNKVKGALAKETRKRAGTVSVVTGFSAAYAVWVHEAPMTLKGKPRPKVEGRKQGKYWDPQGRATNKFLEKSSRKNHKKAGNIVGQRAKQGLTMTQSLLAAGMLIQRDAQLMVPVNTGNLKNSAFTEKE